MAEVISDSESLLTPAIIAAMQRSPIDAPDQALLALRGRFDQTLMDSALCRLIDRWLNQYPVPPIGEYWPLVGMGILGGDGCALKLAALIPRWAGNRYNKRARFSLEVLKTIGTDTALMVLDATARKLKFRSIKSRCAEIFDEIAVKRGIPRSELDDRIVPDCGLDGRGQRSFDYGGRAFRFTLRPGLKPAVKDDAQQLRDNLPPAKKTDDAKLAAAALADWKVFKKQLQDAIKLQSARLEQAMIVGRRWPFADFKTLFVEHPLMTHLVQQLIWGCYGKDSFPTRTFRIGEDRVPMDRSESAIAIDHAESIGIVHPLQMSPADLAGWGEILADYQIVPPFPQIGRPVYRLDPDELAATEITRFNNVAVHAASLVGGLNRRGWERGLGQHGGMVYEHSKPFLAADVTAIVHYDPGVFIAAWQNGDAQKMTSCFFVLGHYKPQYFPAHTKRVPLDRIDSIVISEVLMDLNFIASKAI